MALHHKQPIVWSQLSALESAKLRDIQDCFDEDQETKVLGWAGREPHLFRIPLGSRHGPQIIEVGTEPGESLMHMTSGTFAMHAARAGYGSVMKALLESGLQPDDRSVFIARPLIEFPKWCWRPELMSLALIHGADPNPSLRHLQGDSTSALPKPPPSNEDQFHCLMLLLECGGTEIKPPLTVDTLKESMRACLSAPRLAQVAETVMQRRLRTGQQDAEQPRAAPARRRRIL